MRTITEKIGPFLALSHSAIALAQTAATTTFTLNGSLTTSGVATLDKARRIVIVSAGNDSGISFVIAGTNWSGQPWGETIAGTNAATSGPSVLDYATVTSIAATGTGTHTSGNVAGPAISGTDPTPLASGPWNFQDAWALQAIAMQVNVSGAVNYTVESSLDDPNLTLPQTVVPPGAVNWVAHVALTSATTTQQQTYGAQPVMIRLTMNTASATGYATFDITQAGGGGLA